MNNWYDFRGRCPAIDCNDDINWIHKSCGEHQKVNGYGEIQCLKNLKGEKCLSPTFILELAFKCDDGGHIDYEKNENDRVLDAILVAIGITSLPKKIRKQLIDKINKFDDDD